MPFLSLFLGDEVENIDVTQQQSILGLCMLIFAAGLFVCVCACMHGVWELLQVTVSCRAVLHVFREATVQMCSPPLSS